MMPEEALSASDSDTQPHLKFTDCLGGCGAKVPYRTNSRVYCASCRVEKKRESARRAADAQRRKRGVPQIKGTPFVCIECGCNSVATSGNIQKYCLECAPKVASRASRVRSFGIDPTGTRERFRGKSLICVDCSSEFVADVRRTRCPECTGANRRSQHSGETPCKQCGVVFPSPSRKRIYCDGCQKERRSDAFRRFARKKFNEMRGDTAFDLNTLMRSRMRHSLNSAGGKGGAPWSELVGYTVDDLKNHLEKQFLPGMTWENRGIDGWHIDHIIPIASFNYDGPDHPDFKACWALTNLRPLWAADNIRKKDKLVFLL